MITQEGKLSLWKGFPVYLLGVMFWMSVLPLIVDFVTEKKNEYDGTSSKSIQNQEISQNDNTDIEYNFNEDFDDEE